MNTWLAWTNKNCARVEACTPDSAHCMAGNCPLFDLHQQIENVPGDVREIGAK